MGNGGSSPSARWAADPSGRHVFRYWDGSRWTGHVADGAFAPNRAPEGTEPPDTRTGTEAAEHLPPEHESHDVAPEDEGNTEIATAVPAETVEEHPESRRSERRQKSRRRRAFWLGALIGAGVVLIGVAVAAVALNVKINSNSSTAKRSTVSHATTTTTTIPATTTTVNPGRPPQQVRVEVINASGAPNAAGAKALALGALGYQSAGLADAPVRQGTVVQCKPGFEAEAVTLSKAVGAGTTVEPFPNPPPAGSTNADCVVVLGK